MKSLVAAGREATPAVLWTWLTAGAKATADGAAARAATAEAKMAAENFIVMYYVLMVTIVRAIKQSAMQSADDLVVSMSWKNHVIASNVSDRRDGAFSPLTHAKRSGRESGFDDDEFIIIIR